MSHSVRHHLGIEIRSYDETIRRFIPKYEEMLLVAAREVRRVQPRRVLDLGAGTGALSEVLLDACDSCMMELIDIDPEMLLQARARLRGFKGRVRFSELSFLGPLPSCEGAAASLALHHVRTIDAKRALYGRIFDALESGGVFVNADAAVSADSAQRELTFRGWVGHMVSQGIEESQAFEHLAKWGEEDTYFPINDELSALASAGFEAECVWRHGPMAVMVGRKPD